ncbi:mammalian cell entry protein [Mycobacterium florentinum]|uniref:Mammalian cell entry protein n=1 Tax=Mycobacterium florentinum TaxID=292462 RepID=A0A1X1UKY7_MYCFL|nr:MlaD family protein [Mycobacterium florentinum]MCV7411381.1 MCE family protein [Mycobacterium florentinum]ORV57457.1 mammalian cell entry protein [Mycobacterium florentinum]BBX80741.1 mammalian cell entry protein [Mycobacterium florentinum]
MRLARRTAIQLIVFALIATIAAVVMIVGYMRLPTMLFGTGHYKVTLQLPTSGGLYASGNVTYRGTEVGRVESVRLTNEGVAAVLSLRSDIRIPADLHAEIHSQSAIGEQYVALLPDKGGAPYLKEGDVIPVGKTSVPPPVDSLLDSLNNGLDAIPGDNLKTVVDEAYVAVGGLGPEISRIINGSTTLALDARKDLGPLTTLIDRSKPVLDSQTESADAVRSWAANLATITDQLRRQDHAVGGLIQTGPAGIEKARELIDKLRPTLPILLANLVSVNQVAVTYQASIEQLLVLLPIGIGDLQGAGVANRNTKQDYNGINLDFNLNINLPPPCTTGFLPATQIRPPNFTDAPERPPGDLYCRIPQDSMFAVRGARNLPCITRPGKRAPTVKMCESDENYVPLNEGLYWKGDPNATLSGQPVPQLEPGTPGPQGVTPRDGPLPPMAAAQYDPATGSYVGPDGKTYTETDLGAGGAPRRWQDMLLPAAGP